MAIALNNLPPQYYVSQKGEVFSKLLASYMDTKIKVITEITKAIIQVQKEPHHEAWPMKTNIQMTTFMV